MGDWLALGTGSVTVYEAERTENRRWARDAVIGGGVTCGEEGHCRESCCERYILDAERAAECPCLEVW